MKTRKQKKYYMIRVCSCCSGSLGITWIKEPEGHKKLSHGLCKNCLYEVYYKDWDNLEKAA